MAKKNLKVFVFLLGLLLVTLFPFVNFVKAAESGSVTATVTAQQIAITVTDGSVAYGTLALSGSANTTAQSKNDTQTATNGGNVAEDFNIKGTDSTAWTLESAVGSEMYTHEFCIGSGGNPDPCDTGGTPVWTKLTTDDQTLVTDVAASGTQKFDLKVTVPSSTAATGAQNVNVTITAILHV
jgi:hypothetical protein